MVKKKDIVKVFVIYLSLCHVCPAHPCGENPLRRLISISFKTGKYKLIFFLNCQVCQQKFSRSVKNTSGLPCQHII